MISQEVIIRPVTVLSLWKGHIVVSRLPTGRVGMNLAQIAEAVARKHRISVKDLKGAYRGRTVAWPRQEAMWLAYQEVWPDGRHVYSLPQIGRYFGGRDHTTALHGVRRHQQRLDAAKAVA